MKQYIGKLCQFVTPARDSDKLCPTVCVINTDPDASIAEWDRRVVVGAGEPFLVLDVPSWHEMRTGPLGRLWTDDAIKVLYNDTVGYFWLGSNGMLREVM